MDNGSITPVLPVGTGTDGFGGGNAFIWIFGLLILIHNEIYGDSLNS